jgi:hypothetical protein
MPCYAPIVMKHGIVQQVFVNNCYTQFLGNMTVFVVAASRPGAEGRVCSLHKKLFSQHKECL